MKKKNTRIVAIIVVTTFILTMLLGVFANILMASAASQEELNSLKNELSSVAKEKEEIKKEIKELEKDISSTQSKKAIIDREIDVLSREIDASQRLVNALNKDISTKNTELIAAQEKLSTQYDQYKNRVRVMYENGQSTYLDALIGSKDFIDMISRVEVISQIVDYDKNLIREFNQSRIKIQETKIALETSKKEEVSMKSSLASQKTSLDTKSGQSQQLLSSLNSDKQKSKAEWEKAEKAEAKLQAEIQEIARKLANNSSGEYIGGEFLWPTPGYSKITSNFGYRKHPILGYNKLHTGMDIGAPSGAKIVAVNGGKVVKSTFNSSYGNYVMVDHGGGVVTLYAHMSSRSVQEGATVIRGQQIGKVGSTGWSTGAHLHIEVIKNGEYKNPKGYF